MSARMKNPALIVAEAVKPLQSLHAIANSGNVPPATMGLVHLRASQINGCSFCVDMAVKHAKKAGESDDRLFAVGAWREAPCFTAAERAALALAESVTRISDSSDPVPDSIWNEAARHFEEKALASLLLWIATSNLYNRLNVATRQPAGASLS